MDLTTEWAQYFKDLKAANVAALDVSTLVAKDLTTVRAGAPTELDDANTMYFIYLTAEEE